MTMAMKIKVNPEILAAIAASGTSMSQIREDWPQISENLKRLAGGRTMAEFGEDLASGKAMADLVRVIGPAYEARGPRP